MRVRNGVFFIKHFNIDNWIKAASMTLNKLRTIQTYQIDKSIEKCNILISNQNLSQPFNCMKNKVIHINQNPVSESPPYIHTNRISEKLKKQQKLRI